MTDRLSLERCAAYAAACATLTTVHRAAFAWPDGVADRARATAIKVVLDTATGVGHPHGSVARGRCLSEARVAAHQLAAALDIATAFDERPEPAQLTEARELVQRAIAMLDLFCHANASPYAAD